MMRTDANTNLNEILFKKKSGESLLGKTHTDLNLSQVQKNN